MKFTVSHRRGEPRQAQFDGVKEIGSFKELKEIAQFDHFCGEFINNYRKDENVLRAQCLFLDCDNNESDNPADWLSPEILRELGVACYVIYSRNHNKIKDGKKSARPRFHMYFPFSRVYKDLGEKGEKYREQKEAIADFLYERIGMIIDEKALPASQPVFGVEGADGFEIEGVFIDEYEPFKQFFANWREEKSGGGKKAPAGQDGKAAKHPQQKQQLGGGETIPQGERNATMYNKAIQLRLENYTREETKEDFSSLAMKCDPPLDEKELMTIWNSAMSSATVYAFEFTLANLTCGTVKEIKTQLSKLAQETGRAKEYMNGLQAALNMSVNFERGKNKKKDVSSQRVERLLRRKKIHVRFNVIMQRLEIDGFDGNDRDFWDYIPYNFKNQPLFQQKEQAQTLLPLTLAQYFRARGFTVRSGEIESYLMEIAAANMFNPVEDMLKSCKWDNVDRFSQLMEICGITSEKDKTYFRCQLHQSISLALNDDCTVAASQVLTIQGRQGAGKTQLWRRLAVEPEWFTEGVVLDMNDKDSLMSATKGWIIELGEANVTFNRKQAELKAFITAPYTEIRFPYDRLKKRVSRRCCFVGTVNDERFLQDDTGSRRYPVIKLEKDIDATQWNALPKEWFIQLWRQIYETEYLVKGVQGFRLSIEQVRKLEEDNQAFTKEVPLETEIIDLLDWSQTYAAWQYVSSTQLLRMLNLQNRDAKQCGRALSALARKNQGIKKRILNGATLYLLPKAYSNNYENAADKEATFQQFIEECFVNDFDTSPEMTIEFEDGEPENRGGFDASDIMARMAQRNLEVSRETAEEFLKILLIFKCVSRKGGLYFRESYGGTEELIKKAVMHANTIHI